MERSGIVHQAAQIPVSPAGVPPQCIPEDLDIHAAPAAYHIADGALQVINRHRISKWCVCLRQAQAVQLRLDAVHLHAVTL